MYQHFKRQLQIALAFKDNLKYFKSLTFWFVIENASSDIRHALSTVNFVPGH